MSQPSFVMRAVIANGAFPGLAQLFAEFKGLDSRRDFWSRLLTNPFASRESLKHRMRKLVMSHPIIGTYKESQVRLDFSSVNLVEIVDASPEMLAEAFVPDRRLVDPTVAPYVESLEIKMLDLPAGDWPPNRYICGANQLEGDLDPDLRVKLFVTLAEQGGPRGTRYDACVVLLQEGKDADEGTFYALATAIYRSLRGVHTWRADNSPVPRPSDPTVAPAPPGGPTEATVA